jgi:hypothetical protein
MVALLFVANMLDIGADLGAMGEAVRLLLPTLPSWLLILVFAAGTIWNQQNMQRRLDAK